MSVEKLNSRIIRYRLVDEESSGVLYYTLDLDKYSLSIGGETSAYYKWFETPKTESFIKLMLRCDSWYLMDKLFNKVFDLEKSIEATKKHIEDSEWFYRKDEKEFLNEIEHILADSADLFMYRVLELLEEYGVKLDGDDEYSLWTYGVELNYKHWDRKAADMFCKFIKPELLKVSE